MGNGSFGESRFVNEILEELGFVPRNGRRGLFQSNGLLEYGYFCLLMDSERRLNKFDLGLR